MIPRVSKPLRFVVVLLMFGLAPVQVDAADYTITLNAADVYADGHGNKCVKTLKFKDDSHKFQNIACTDWDKWCKAELGGTAPKVKWEINFPDTDTKYQWFMEHTPPVPGQRKHFGRIDGEEGQSYERTAVLGGPPISVGGSEWTYTIVAYKPGTHCKPVVADPQVIFNGGDTLHDKKDLEKVAKAAKATKVKLWKVGAATAVGLLLGWFMGWVPRARRVG